MCYLLFPLYFHLAGLYSSRVVWTKFLQHILVTEPFVAIGKPELQVCKASHCGRRQQQRSHTMITLFLLVRATCSLYVRLPDVLERQELSLNLLSKRVLSSILEKHLVILEYFLASLKIYWIFKKFFIKELLITLSIQESRINKVNEQNNV